MILEIIRFIMSIVVIITFVTDIIIRWQYKRELKKLVKKMRNESSDE